MVLEKNGCLSQKLDQVSSWELALFFHFFATLLYKTWLKKKIAILIVDLQTIWKIRKIDRNELSFYSLVENTQEKTMMKEKLKKVNIKSHFFNF